ncbi:MAG: chemotaxis-specific protein-glutamate methyltransferase CheB [Jatrophihabitans sp.]|uniref:chemotaxis-specific protein-glutamate methyltransferase CheB n=1 Tax=Jatrophihabitans sp. TaxID=1932789 RepID=UPI003F80C22E
MTVRALVVDDSVVVRRTVATVLDAAGDIEVVGTASDGRIGLRRIAELEPDVVTLDVEMPGLTGIETLAEIRKSWPSLPVIMYSTLTERGAVATLDALALGANDYATKPSGANNRDEVADQVRDSLLPKVRMWGSRYAERKHPASSAPPASSASQVLTPPRRTVAAAPVVTAAPVATVAPRTGAVDLLVVGVSTGGPDALATLLPMLPANLPVPVVLVQHMPPVFTAMLAQRLDKISPLTVVEAAGGELAKPGTVYVAPGGHHVEVTRTAAGYRLELSDIPPENSCRPAVDVLFRTAAKAAKAGVLGVVLTGMGQDGLEGAKNILAAGGQMIVQDEATSVVWGMPGFVAKAGLASAVLPLDQLAGEILRRTPATL